MEPRHRSALRGRILLTTLAAGLAAHAPARATDAEVVFLIGKAEVQETAQADWKPAAVQQQLNAGTAIRTGNGSQIALVLRDQTQVRLNEQTMLRITGVAVEGAGTNVELSRGRVWTQAKQYFSGVFRSVTSGVVSAQRFVRVPLRVTTPTATVGIRGTDWELVVDEGRTVVTVLSGEVELANNMGVINVAANEQGVAEAGKAPVKSLLSNARDRVQWVTAYRPAPRRWVVPMPVALESAARAIEAGEYAQAAAVLEPAARASAQAAVLLADLRLSEGRAGDAVTLLAQHPGDAAAIALRMRALAIAGRLDEARALADATAPVGAAGNTEYDLARADVARIDGNAEAALRIFGEVATASPQNADAPFGLGRIQGERDDIRAALPLIDQAIRLAPNGPGFLGERATVETQANEFAAARASFDEALKRNPDDYLALTGLGILQLRTGATAEALDTLLKAGVIEPRFSRAVLYTGVAYYRLGNRERAQETVRRAAEIDPKDPLPWVMLSMMQNDALELGAATESAREAQVRMPYLKSLNQILNDQKGSANLGSSLSNFGLEEWATFYANEAYSPYWAGSHLFLADRYTGLFNKNSELMKGFITDPTVFGASNRFSSLVAVPGNYARADLFLERNNNYQQALVGTLNGLAATPVPIAYYLSGDLSANQSRDDDSTARGGNLTLGVGIKPRYDIGLFAFGTTSDIRSDLRGPSTPTGRFVLPSDKFVQKENRADVGINFKLSPTNQFWFKLGDGRQSNGVDGSLLASNGLIRAANPIVLTPVGRLDRFGSNVTQQDLQFRHAFDVGGWHLTWGLERATQDIGGRLANSFSGLFGINPAFITNLSLDTYTVRSTDAYVGARWAASERLEVQVDGFAQDNKARRASSDSVTATIPAFAFTVNSTTVSDTQQHTSEFNPRLALKWRFSEHQTLRLAGQKWRRPASAGTLSPIDSLGIAVNDRLPVAGGLYQRTRLQYDGEYGASLFVQAFLDKERVDNGVGGARTAIVDFQNEQLQSLRNRVDVFTARPDLERTPVFGAGTIRTIGLATNYRLSSSQTLSVRYLYRNSRQAGGANDGLAVPYMPKNYLLLGSQWALAGRWLFGANAAYRSLRYRDDINQDAAQHGWNYGLTAYWESADKRFNMQGILDNLLSRTNAAAARTLTDAHLVLRFGYRF